MPEVPRNLLQNTELDHAQAQVSPEKGVSGLVSLRLGVGKAAQPMTLTPTYCMELNLYDIQKAREAKPQSPSSARLLHFIGFREGRSLKSLKFSYSRINMYIRSDTSNKWLLRAPLPKFDKKIFGIASATLSDPSGMDYLVNPIHEKVERERLLYAEAACQLGLTVYALGGHPPPDKWVQNFIRDKKVSALMEKIET